MHEMSIALEVGRMAERQLGRAQIPLVVAVGLDVGDDAGVEFAALEFCMEAVLTTPPFTGARPVITRCTGDTLRLTYLEVDDGRPND